MGLDFSHGDAHWAYSGFDLFRRKIASIVMETEIDNLYDGRMIYKYMSAEPIYPFINHSDCDGELTPDELEKLIPQLEDAVNKLEDEDTDKARGLELIKGMKEALRNNNNLRFC